MARCAQGHESASTDYCDVCGDPIDAAAAPAVGTPVSANAVVAPSASASGSAPAAELACAHCGGSNPPGALFCEDCGYDFTTGQIPNVAAPNSLSLDPVGGAPGSTPSTTARGSSAASTAGVVSKLSTTGWVVEVWIDPDWFALHGVALGDPCPSAGTPKVVGLQDGTTLIGRTSKSRSVHPEVDCGMDSAVSHRHAQLSHDGDRWFVEDLGSTNGTYIAVAGAPLPEVAIDPNVARELAANERIQLGAWTRLVVRPALPGE